MRWALIVCVCARMHACDGVGRGEQLITLESSASTCLEREAKITEYTVYREFVTIKSSPIKFLRWGIHVDILLSINVSMKSLSSIISILH